VPGDKSEIKRENQKKVAHATFFILWEIAKI